MKIDRVALRKKIEIQIQVEQEDDSYRDAHDHGKTEDGAANIEWIQSRLESGSVWAWAHVRVLAKYQDIEGWDSMGCCSYEDEAAFRRCDYFEQLVGEAVKQIATTLEEIVEDHEIWVHDRTMCIPCAAVDE